MPSEILDQSHIPFQLVKGAPGFSGWRGMEKDSDPSGLEPNQLLHALNVRFDAGRLIGRQGSTQIADLEGVPYFMGAFNQNPRNRLWLAIRGCFGVGAETGASISVYDPSISDVVLPVSRYLGAIDSTPHFGSLGNHLFLGFNSLLREIPIVDAPLGKNPYELGASTANLAIKNFEGFTIVGMLEFREISTLFIALQDQTTPTNGKIVSFNGLSFIEEYTGLRPYAFGRWRNQIIAGFAGGIRWRDNTSSTWTSVASGGFTCYPSPNAITEYQAKTYIAGGVDTIYSYNGTAIAAERVIATVGSDGITAVATHFDGLMYYLWNAGGTNGMKVGKHDVESSSLPFIDTYKDLEAQNANFTHGSGLLSWASVLYATRTQETLLASPIADLLGTWGILGGGSAGTNFAVVSLFDY